MRADAAAEREWTLPMTDRRRALLIAALAAVRVNSRAQELVMLHAWLTATRTFSLETNTATRLP